MNTRESYCPRCSRPVRLAETRMPGHLGHANLEDPETVCLDYGPHCTGERCAATGDPRLVMAVRLAASGLKDTPWPMVRMHCRGCGETRELEVLDTEHGHCTVCGSVVAWACDPAAPGAATV